MNITDFWFEAYRPKDVFSQEYAVTPVSGTNDSGFAQWFYGTQKTICCKQLINSDNTWCSGCICGLVCLHHDADKLYCPFYGKLSKSETMHHFG